MVPDSFYLSEDQLDKLSSDQLGNLDPIIEWEEGRLDFTIRDSVDHSLRVSRRLLIEIGDRVELLAASGSSLCQALLHESEPEARFAAQWREGPVKDILLDISPLRALLPIASGVMRSGRLRLVDDEGKTRARARLRELSASNGHRVIVVTTEGLRGYDKSLGELVERIKGCGGRSLAAGNLYRLIEPTCVRHVSRPSVDIAGDESAFDAATDLIAAHLPVAVANEAGIIADLDTEFLHDYRVALRKIRSVLSLFKGVYAPDQTLELKARFSALMAPTGALRDLDVYLLDQQRFYDLVPEVMHEGLDAMFVLIGERRAGEQAALTERLGSEAYKAEMKALSKLFRKRRKLAPGPNAEQHSYAFACDLIGKRYRKIGRLAAALTSDTPDAEVHALRIECKKLRYLLEFFGPVFAKDRLRAVLKPLKRLQESLGLFNDYAVQQAALLAFSDALQEEPRKMDMVQSIGALVVVLHQRQAAEREKILASFADFNSPEMQRAFRRLLRAEKES